MATRFRIGCFVEISKGVCVGACARFGIQHQTFGSHSAQSRLETPVVLAQARRVFTFLGKGSQYEQPLDCHLGRRLSCPCRRWLRIESPEPQAGKTQPEKHSQERHKQENHRQEVLLPRQTGSNLDRRITVDDESSFKPMKRRESKRSSKKRVKTERTEPARVEPKNLKRPSRPSQRSPKKPQRSPIVFDNRHVGRSKIIPDRGAQKSPSAFAFLLRQLRRDAACDIAPWPWPMSNR